MRATNEDASPKRSRSKNRRRSNKSRRERARTIAEKPDGLGALADSAAEETFFAQACDFPPVELELESNEVKPLLLRPEQLARRQWLRRQVARLMAGLGTFSVIATAVQIASQSP